MLKKIKSSKTDQNFTESVQTPSNRDYETEPEKLTRLESKKSQDPENFKFDTTFLEND